MAHGRARLGGGGRPAPATASAAGLIAAYDRYETGKGFEIGLKNAASGANIALPAGVNTADDELHPALSADGRYLAFTRMKLQPKLNGDIVLPQLRSLFWLDRQTGTITQLAAGDGGVGPVFTSKTTTSSTLSWGIRPEFPPSRARGRRSRRATRRWGARPGSAPYLPRAQATSARPVRGRGPTSRTPPRSSGCSPSRSSRPAASPAPWAATPATCRSPPTIRSAGRWRRAPRGSPASASGAGLAQRLGHVRRAGVLGIFNSTPGIQTVVNPPVDIGPDAPTPQTRQFQSVYGGLAVAESNEPAVAPLINCTASCINALQNASSPPLKPKLSFTTAGQTIGIFVVRVTGKRKLLGRSVPRIRLVGRVPRGRTRKGTNSFRWNLRVNGKRLKPGTHLLTYRALKRNKVLNTSDSIRFTVTKSGKIRNPRRQR